MLQHNSAASEWLPGEVGKVQIKAGYCIEKSRQSRYNVLNHREVGCTMNG